MGRKKLPTDELNLTAREHKILDYLKEAVLQRGYPPTVRELCDAMNVKSTSTIHKDLQSLEDKGFIKKDPAKPRALEIIGFDRLSALHRYAAFSKEIEASRMHDADSFTQSGTESIAQVSSSSYAQPGTESTAQASGSSYAQPGTESTAQASGSSYAQPGTESTAQASGSSYAQPGTESTAQASGSSYAQPGTESTAQASGSSYAQPGESYAQTNDDSYMQHTQTDADDLAASSFGAVSSTHENTPSFESSSDNYANIEDIYDRPSVVQIPLVGQVAAGTPILAKENITEFFPIPERYINSGSDHFMLTVKGDSMIEAGIFDGDLILVRSQNTARNGDMAVAMIDGFESEATVKTFYREGDHIRLQPENSSMSPIIVRDVKILGIVKGVFRYFN